MSAGYDGDPRDAELARLRAEVERLNAELDAAIEREHAADNWFRLLAESMPLLVFTARADGVIDYVNPAFWEFIGREPDQAALEAGAWLRQLHRDDRDATARLWAAAVASGDDYVTTFRIRRHDGVFRWHDVLGYPIRDDEGHVVAWFGAAADVHDARLVEESLAERQERLRIIFDNMPDSLMVVGADRAIAEISPAGCELLEIDAPEEVLGSSGIEFVHPDDVDHMTRFTAGVRAGRPDSTIVRIIGRRGTLRWIETHAVPLEPDDDGGRAVLTVTRDITDRHRDATLLQAESVVHAGLLAGEPLEHLLEVLATALDEVVEGHCAILLAEDGRFRGGVAPGLPAGFLAGVEGVPLDPQSGPCSRAGASGRPVIPDDLGETGPWGQVCEVIEEVGLTACVPLPVVDGAGEVVAVLALYLPRFRPPTAGERAALERAARLAGLAIERRRADVAMRRTSDLLAISSELGQLGGWSVDVPPTRVLWSDEVAAIHARPAGYSPPVAEGISYYAPESRPIISEAFRSCVEQGIPYDLELQIIDANGLRKWCRTVGRAERDASGRIVRVAGAFQDISDAKRSVEALRESEERFRLLAEATSDVVFDWDIRGGQVWYGEGRDRLFGDDRGPTLPAATVMEGCHPDDRDRVAQRFVDVVRGGSDRWSDEFRVVRSDGVQVPVRGSGFVLRDGDGRGVRVVGSLVDMTVEHELQGQLAQAQRLEAVGQLTGGVAHDFNNLLTVILGNVDLLTSDLASPEPPGHDELVQIAETISTAAHRGADLTRQLLAFARRQPLDPVEVDIDTVIQRLMGLLRRTLGEDVDVRAIGRGVSRPALADASQLDSALLNICINARDAMPGGGVLTIGTTETRVDVPGAGDAREAGPAPGDYVVIAITDSGSGMLPEIVDRVFDPFFSTKAPGRGTGLGLSMVYGFAKQSGGHVDIDSRLGRGTTVRLWLPVAPGERPAERPPPIEPRTRQGGRERILLVEDEELVREVVAAQLRTLGYEVVEAADGPSALALLRDAGPFHLLFTDVVMPGGLNGFEVADAAVSAVPELPVLMTSGYADDAVVRQGSVGRERRLLAKPYRFDELAAQVRAVIDARVNAG